MRALLVALALVLSACATSRAPADGGEPDAWPCAGYDYRRNTCPDLGGAP